MERIERTGWIRGGSPDLPDPVRLLVLLVSVAWVALSPGGTAAGTAAGGMSLDAAESAAAERSGGARSAAAAQGISRAGASAGVEGVREIDAWIPMADGVRLAADVFLPDDGAAGRESGASGSGAAPQTGEVDGVAAGEGPPGAGGAMGASGERYPVLLEYLPYRKDDAVARSWTLYPYFVRRGYVVARVDVRGTGRSEGTLPDYEYSERELEDGEEVIAWLARQPWSTGDVGMFGISWGGFNSIQMAMRRPPALKAIVALMATDDLYQDDIHYIDGLMHVDQYEINQDLANAVTATPELPVDEESLRRRFDTTPWLLRKLRHQRDGPFWDRGSLNEDYGRIGIPVFLVGGWYDGYRDSVPRMLEHLDAPVKAIVGPWNHAFPHDAVPGPEIEWRREAVRWWDRWLKGRDNGVEEEPAFAVYVRGWHPPDPGLERIPGEWRLEEGWPVRRLRSRELFLRPDRGLGEAPASPATHRLRYVPTAGLQIGFWWGELVPDQRPADAYSLVYETPPLEEELEILGMPRALLRASADAPLAHWIVRLSDVAPDGRVTLVTGAGINGAHRNSASEPEELESGVPHEIPVDLHFTSWVFPAGHRIRVAVSNAAWPMIWPTPDPMITTLHVGGEGGSRVVLPVVPGPGEPGREERSRPSFAPPAPPVSYPAVKSTGAAWPGEWRVERDELSGTTTVVWEGSTSTRYPWGDRSHRESIVYRARDDDPADASVIGETETAFELADGRELLWRARMELRSDRNAFHYDYTRRLYRDGEPIRERSWSESVPRDHQ